MLCDRAIKWLHVCFSRSARTSAAMREVELDEKGTTPLRPARTGVMKPRDGMSLLASIQLKKCSSSSETCCRAICWLLACKSSVGPHSTCPWVGSSASNSASDMLIASAQVCAVSMLAPRSPSGSSWRSPSSTSPSEIHSSKLSSPCIAERSPSDLDWHSASMRNTVRCTPCCSRCIYERPDPSSSSRGRATTKAQRLHGWEQKEGTRENAAGDAQRTAKKRTPDPQGGT